MNMYRTIYPPVRCTYIKLCQCDLKLHTRETTQGPNPAQREHRGRNVWHTKGLERTSAAVHSRNPATRLLSCGASISTPRFTDSLLESPNLKKTKSIGCHRSEGVR